MTLFYSIQKIKLFLLLIVPLRNISLKNVAAISLSLVTPYILLHAAIHPAKPGFFTTENIARNIPFVQAEFTDYAFNSNFRFLIFIGLLFILAVMGLRKSNNELLKSVFWIAPVFILQRTRLTRMTLINFLDFRIVIHNILKTADA